MVLNIIVYFRVVFVICVVVYAIPNEDQQSRRQFYWRKERYEMRKK